jgi:hypothetical protein
MAPTGAPPEQHPRAGSQATVRQADHPLRQPRGPHGTGRSRRLLGGWTERRGLARWWPCLWRSPAPWVQRSGPSRTSQPRHTALALAISGPDAERGTNSRGDARQAAATGPRPHLAPGDEPGICGGLDDNDRRAERIAVAAARIRFTSGGGAHWLGPRDRRWRSRCLAEQTGRSAS